MLPAVSVVIIGRNEAENLPACIQSIRAMDYPPECIEVLYVDTDSTDGSPDMARALGVTVYEEHSDFPSAGRARNRGWREARHEIVHFVDGDMVVAPGYLREAVKYLGQDHVVSVFGLLDERRLDDNWLSRIMHYSWEVKAPGEVDAPGAGGTFLREALAAVDGYNPDVLQGEETELGYRLRERGGRIVLLQLTMGTHDYDLHSLADILRRYYRGTGYSFGRLLELPASPSLAELQRLARRNIRQGAALAAVTGILLVTGQWLLLAGEFVAVPAYVAAKYWQPAERRQTRIPYFFLDYLGRPAALAGLIAYRLRARRRRAGVSRPEFERSRGDAR